MPSCLSQLNCFSHHFNHQLRSSTDRSSVQSRSTVNLGDTKPWGATDHIKQVRKIVKDYDDTKNIARNLYDASVNDGFKTGKKLRLKNIAFDFSLHSLDPAGKELNVHDDEKCVTFPENIELKCCSLLSGKMQFYRGTVKATGGDAELFLVGKAIGIAYSPSSKVWAKAHGAVGFATNGAFAYASVAGATAAAMEEGASAHAVSTGAIAIAMKGRAYSACGGALAVANSLGSHATASMGAVALAIGGGEAIAQNGGLAFAFTPLQGNEKESTAHADTGGIALAEGKNTLAVCYKGGTLVRQEKQTNFVFSSGKCPNYKLISKTQNSEALVHRDETSQVAGLGFPHLVKYVSCNVADKARAYKWEFIKNDAHLNALLDMKQNLDCLVSLIPRESNDLSIIQRDCDVLHLLWRTRPATEMGRSFQEVTMRHMQGEPQQSHSSSDVFLVSIEENGLTQNVKSSGVQKELESGAFMKIEPSPVVMFLGNDFPALYDSYDRQRRIDAQEQLQRNDTQHEQHGDKPMTVARFCEMYCAGNTSSETIMLDNASGVVDTEGEGQISEDDWTDTSSFSVGGSVNTSYNSNGEETSFMYCSRESSLATYYNQPPKNVYPSSDGININQLHSQPLKKGASPIKMGALALESNRSRNNNNVVVVQASPVVICPIEQQLEQKSNIQNAGLNSSRADSSLTPLSNNLKEPVKKMGELTLLETTV